MKGGRAAGRLGSIAVLPFVMRAALAWSASGDAQALAMRTLAAYAAVVASFIGAIHWGFGFTQAAPRAALFVWGVVPAIVAWLALLVGPRPGSRSMPCCWWRATSSTVPSTPGTAPAGGSRCGCASRCWPQRAARSGPGPAEDTPQRQSSPAGTEVHDR